MNYTLSEIAKTRGEFRPIRPLASQPITLWRIYASVIGDWRDAAAGVLAGWTLGQSASALSDELDSHNEEILAAIAGLQFAVFFANLEKWHRGKWVADVKRAAKVDVSLLLGEPTGQSALMQTRAQRRAGGVINAAKVVRVAPAGLTRSAALTGIDAKLADAVAQNASLVRSVSDDTRARIANAVFSGLQSGMSKVEVARQINKGLRISSKRARRISDDQVDKAVASMTRFRSEEAGLFQFKWLHTAQKNPRHDHLARDGKIYRWDEVDVLPATLPNCKCSALPWWGE